MAYFKGNSIELSVELFKEFVEESKIDTFLSEDLESRSYRFSSNIEIYLYTLPNEAIQKLIDFLTPREFANKNSVMHKLKQYNNLLSSFKTKLPKQLPDLVSVLKLLSYSTGFDAALSLF